MRRAEDHPSDPAAQAALAVIDATLAGQVVDPEHAELAELALILAGQRPEPDPGFAAGLDRRVAEGFATPARRPRAGQRGRRLLAPAALGGLAAAAAVVFALSSSAGGPPGSRVLARDLSSAGASSSSASSTTAAPASKVPAGTSSTAAPAPATAGPASSAQSSSVPAGAPPVAGPPTANRQVVQAAQLSLSARPGQVASVAQQVFEVIGAEHGVVQSSTVTAGGDGGGYAEFQLSVPSANLQPALLALSGLRGAAVLSRSDSSQDITGQVGGAGRQLADARALRTSLLRRLAVAPTTTAIDSLRRQIRDAEASISSDLSTLRGLHRQVDYTQISVTVNAAMGPGHPVAAGGSFTLGQAAHDAARVLVVAAGVALIALAVLLPVSLLAAIGLWGAHAVRRRRREQALDLI